MLKLIGDFMEVSFWMLAVLCSVPVLFFAAIGFGVGAMVFLIPAVVFSGMAYSLSRGDGGSGNRWPR